MFANKIQINLSTLSGTSATTINIPINMDFQIVDNGELVERVFVDVETERSINPIVDYEKTRFLPLDLNGNQIDKVIYVVEMLSGNTYGDIGFTDEDIKFEKENFKKTFVNLNFYDTDNPFTQKLLANITLYSQLKDGDLIQIGAPQGVPGQPKPAKQIPINYVLESPVLNVKGFAEGYHLYDYKDELIQGQQKYLYMRASFKNAKTGRSTNLMVKNTALPIDELVHELYTRYILVRDNTGYYYKIDHIYRTSLDPTFISNTPILINNVIYTTNPTKNTVTVKLYQINAL